MHIAEVVTIAKSLPLLRLNTYKSLILSYSADYRRIFLKKKRNFAVKLDVELNEWRMKQAEERYISLLTDFGFKRIFGTAMNKDLIICFLNSLFNGRQVVKDVSYLNPEHVGGK